MLVEWPNPFSKFSLLHRYDIICSAVLSLGIRLVNVEYHPSPKDEYMYLSRLSDSKFLQQRGNVVEPQKRFQNMRSIAGYLHSEVAGLWDLTFVKLPSNYTKMVQAIETLSSRHW